MYTRASPTDIPERRSARAADQSAKIVMRVRLARGELNGPRAPLQAVCRGRPTSARQSRRLPREDPRAEVGEEVRVGVGVRVGPVEFS